MKFVQISACATVPKVGYGWMHDFHDFDEGAPVGTWKKVEEPHS